MFNREVLPPMNFLYLELYDPIFRISLEKFGK